MKTCIWGAVDNQDKVAVGITWVNTPSHGGFVLSKKRFADMSPKFKQCSFTHDHNFEEDISWCGVVLMWPEYFTAEQHNVAQGVYQRRYATN